jgi:leader peptidase (prepilin peptidase) / N-methyltransferase
MDARQLSSGFQGNSVVAAFVSLPLSLRMLLVLLLSVVASRFANWAIYSWAHFSRQLGPWAKPPQGHAPHTWADHLPVVGWWLLRRESKEHGASYWLRPLLIELIFPLAVTWYFQFLVNGGTLPISLAMFVPLFQDQLHGQFIGHFVLITLMTIATFIDFDEQSIPDSITIPGTVIGLLGAAFVPGWMGFTSFLSPVGGEVPIEMDSCKPNTWLVWLNGEWGLNFAVAIVLVWGFALLDRRIILRRGLKKMVVYFFARMLRPHWLWKVVVVVSAAMLVGIVMAWNEQIMRWQYLLSSLFGLACAGGMTWAVRISASAALRAQALGFGDVTLMAMIGTYVGWQPSILIFFIAPLMAVLIVVIQYLLTGEKAAPYGPYLCAATVALVVLWNRLWFSWAMPVFALGLQILAILAACVVMMGAMLWIWRLIRGVLWSEDHS